MSQRILTLSGYLFRSHSISLGGLLFALLTLAFYVVFFDPGQQTPDSDYYVLLIGVFGMVMTFLVTVTVAARANRAVHFPFLVRLPSRIEYLAAIFVTSIVFSATLQLSVAVAALAINGPEITLQRAVEIPPLWAAANILAATLALHATDLVVNRWSRVYIFGILAVLLYGRLVVDPLGSWLSTQTARFGSGFLEQGWAGLAAFAYNTSEWIESSGVNLVERALGVVFWPIKAIPDAVISGSFSEAQAMAPAIMLLYATILFLLASDFLATKDLHMTE